MPGSFRSIAFPPPAGFPYVGSVLTDGTQAFAAFADGHSKSTYMLLDLATGTTRTVPVPGAVDLGGPVALVNGRLGLVSWSRTSAGESYRYDPAHWSFVTGPKDKILELARLSNVQVQPAAARFDEGVGACCTHAAGQLRKLVQPWTGARGSDSEPRHPGKKAEPLRDGPAGRMKTCLAVMRA